MRATPANPSTARDVSAHLQQLATAVAARGLTVRAYDRGGFLLARNEASAGEGVHRAMNPGLSQIVVLAAHKDGSLAWWWQWPGATRDAPPEYEPICAADDIDYAAGRIATVLRVDQPTGTEQ